jgi:adenylate kinase
VDLLIFGPQGAGKGTQAARISDEYGIPHIATGDILRAAIAGETELGLRVKPIVDRGDLVPDDLVVALIQERVGAPDAAGGFVLDGFPRTLPQAEALETMLSEIGRELDAVIVLEVPDEVARTRMLERARTDDTPETIAKRLGTYHEQTAPLVEWYRARDKVAPIDGTPEIGEVWFQIEQALERFRERHELSGADEQLGERR